MRSPRTLYHGSYVHAVSLEQSLEYVESALICVSELGIIEWIEKDVEGSMIQEIVMRHGVELDDSKIEIVELAQEGFLCPGLVDTHTHAPQFPNLGLGDGVKLLDWLDQLTFPEESKYSDVEYAKGVYNQVVRRTLNAGTTTSCYYGTLHVESTKALVDICLERGQRALVGKCSMDRFCPDYYIESTPASIDSVQSFIDHFPNLQRKGQPSPSSESSLAPLVQPVLTPRMAMCTSSQLMSHLVSLSESYEPPLAIQTHLSENEQEIRDTMAMYPDCKTYTGVYAKHGLLGEETILAHCVHLNDEERKVIQRSGAGVSHCPTSNINLDSGVPRVREMLDMGIKVGLGTDCSGGYALGLLSNLRLASHMSRQLSYGRSSSPYKPLTVSEIFYLATMGGASLCRLQQTIGNFVPGKEFDALRIQPASPGMWVGRDEPVKKRFERWFWCGDDRDLAEVYVRGKQVGGVWVK